MDTLNSVVGGWSLAMMVRRPALSLWQAVYGFTAARPHYEGAALPEAVVWEFWSALILSPFFHAAMTSSWRDGVLVLSSSLSGVAIVAATCGLEEIQKEAQSRVAGRLRWRQPHPNCRSGVLRPTSRATLSRRLWRNKLRGYFILSLGRGGHRTSNIA